MYVGDERRTEKRLNCDWVIWFTRDLNGNPEHGVVHDLSSKAVAFSCHASENFPIEDHELVVYFYVPNTELPDSLRKVTRVGRIGRVDSLDKFLRRINLAFYEPLPFRPGELEAVNMVLGNNDDKDEDDHF
ncbi:MAG: hypothetical protein FVQ80_02610 [Planctomycetes bacterium]|nr:hypothetical protein [Planctomycetota bacterium]